MGRSNYQGTPQSTATMGWAARGAERFPPSRRILGRHPRYDFLTASITGGHAFFAASIAGPNAG
jgi:hypothetical protein